jgi:hypothetical protein
LAKAVRMAFLAKTVLMFGATCLLAGCSPPEIMIKVQRMGGVTRLGFTQDWGTFSDDPTVPCIYRISLQKPGTFDVANAVWSIEAEGDVQCLDIAGVKIGQVPKGWREQVPLTAVTGQAYTIEVYGIGSGQASITW